MTDEASKIEQAKRILKYHIHPVRSGTPLHYDMQRLCDLFIDPDELSRIRESRQNTKAGEPSIFSTEPSARLLRWPDGGVCLVTTSFFDAHNAIQNHGLIATDLFEHPPYPVDASIYNRVSQWLDDYERNADEQCDSDGPGENPASYEEGEFILSDIRALLAAVTPKKEEADD